MKISLEWLNDFYHLPSNIDANKIANELTLHTCEVEGVESNFSNFDNIVVGEIKKISSHPNADKLKIAQTDVGGEVIQIVCGGTNIYKGMKCIVAKIGAKVFWHGDKEMIMEKVSLRGVESNGMICAADEVLLGDVFKHKDKEVVDLKDRDDLKVGDKISKILGEERVILDVDNKSLTNRPDLWGHFGIAREISAIFDVDFKDIKLQDIKTGDDKVKVNIQAKDRCPRFSIVKISGLKIEESPSWMKKRLEDAGVRAISNIVDVTNYVMLELGQPMHAYDARYVKGGFNVRLSKKGEKFTTLDDIERNLTGYEVLVCDDEKILGLGGIMGGLASEVKQDTDTIYLESANWTAAPIRRTGTLLGLRTEAVARYEKNLDPNLTEIALIRAINLLKELCPSIKIETAITDIKNFEEDVIKIDVSLKKAKIVIGVDLKDDEMISHLEKLGFKVQKKSNSMISVTVPSFRATGDISMEDDIIEELARMIGYNKIVGKDLIIKSKRAVLTDINALERKIRYFLKGLTFSEVMNYSFVSKGLLSKLNQKIDNLIALKKALSSELTHVRDSLIPRMLEVASKNKIRNSLKLFEIGHVHFKNKIGQDNLPLEDINLCCLICRKKSKKNKRDIFFSVKGVIEALLKEFGLDGDFVLSKESSDFLSVNALVKCNKKAISLIGDIDTKVLNNFDLGDKEIGVFEMSLKKLLRLKKDKINYKPLPKYPSVINGMTLLVPEKVTISDIKKSISKVNSELIRDIDVIDIYRGEQIGDNKKSVVLDITYMANDRTLEEKDVQKIHNKILNNLKELNIVHR